MTVSVVMLESGPTDVPQASKKLRLFDSSQRVEQMWPLVEKVAEVLLRGTVTLKEGSDTEELLFGAAGGAECLQQLCPYTDNPPSNMQQSVSRWEQLRTQLPKDSLQYLSYQSYLERTLQKYGKTYELIQGGCNNLMEEALEVLHYTMAINLRLNGVPGLRSKLREHLQGRVPIFVDTLTSNWSMVEVDSTDGSRTFIGKNWFGLLASYLIES